MKILLIVNNVFYKKRDGLYTFRAIGEFANELVELGHTVEMFQTTIENEDKFHDFNLNDSPIRITALGRSFSKTFTYIYAYFIGFYKVMRSDFLYLYYPTNYHFLALLSIILRKKYGLNVRGQAGVDSKISRFLYKNAHVVFTVSPNFTEIVNQAGGNGLTQRPGISFNSDDIVYNRSYISKKRYRFLYLGRLDKEKGLLELLEAIHSLKVQGIDNFKFDIVGDGYHEVEIKQKSKQLKLDDLIQFHGGVTDLSQLKTYYINSDLFVLPTYHEGFPRTLYEAMIFGVPIITTFVGGIPSLMKDKFNCLKITPKSSNSIETAIKSVLLSYQDMEILTKNATSTVERIIYKDRPSHAKELSSILN
ncbi:glycosyltransferase [Flavobacterium sp. 2]|uniref:glycosyltransferase n=1 Tax=Flavobacterium sp. 2 TaxID=308053 RepID=UPI000C197709|nr:glycosyltransferase [Flavobacterium sp. 2]PIF59336.1 glycosyltransferase involved in cell wall biosynthesis [Flavobacterium sp. 2]